VGVLEVSRDSGSLVSRDIAEQRIANLPRVAR
jgi:hypothetical protein